MLCFIFHVHICISCSRPFDMEWVQFHFNLVPLHIVLNILAYAKCIDLFTSHRNLELLVRLPGGDSVRGFFMVTLLVELAAAPALRVKTHWKNKPIHTMCTYERAVWGLMVFECWLKNYENHIKANDWNQGNLTLDMYCRTSPMWSMVSSVVTLRLWPEPWRTSASLYKTWQTYSSWCKVVTWNVI